jgi:hypothetical protein
MTVANGPAVRASTTLAARVLGLACVFGAFLSASGALDTEAAPAPARLLYWVAISLISAAMLQATHGFVARRWSGWSVFRQRAAGLLVLTLPLTFIAVLTCKLLFGGHPSSAGFLLLLPGMVSILVALQLALAVFTNHDRPDRAHYGIAARLDEPASQIRQLSLPLSLRGARIEALEAEDHYVRVYTTQGEALLRMRFGDAVAMVAHLDGIRPHRSWWVARDAAASLSRDGSRATLTLLNGLRIPISRRYRPTLGPEFRRPSK